MFYYKSIIVFTIITVSLSISMEISSLNEPERCCEPKQYSSKITLSTGMALPDGKMSTTYSYYNYSYDANRGMAGMKGVSINIPDEEKTRLWIIQNITNGQMYVINLDTKQCEKSTMPVQPSDCIPKTATYIDSSNYGYGDKQIIGDTWLIKMNQTYSYSTVSRGDCVVLATNTFILQTKMVTGLTTTNFVPRIDDPSVFDIPSECQHLI